MSSEASSSESFILLLFFQRSQNPFFQKSHFSKKSAPFSPLFSPILSTTRFCFAPFHASFTIKSLSNSLYFSHQILHSFTQFIETWFLALLEARFWPSLHKITPRKMHKFDLSCSKLILSPQSIVQNNHHLHFMTTTLFNDLLTHLQNPSI